MKRILIIINKNWEADAAFAALFNPDFKADLPPEIRAFWTTTFAEFWEKLQPGELDYPHTREQGDPRPIVVFKRGTLAVEIWCLNNIMTPGNAKSYWYSFSFQKAIDLAKINNYSSDPIKLVVAFGTAGVPTELTKNGSLVIGSGVFSFNAGKTQSEQTYIKPTFGELLSSTIEKNFFDQMNIGLSSIAMKQFFETSTLITPQNPSTTFQVIADKDIVAIGDMNTSNYGDFASCDKAAVELFNQKKKDTPSYAAYIAYSVETTHGIIRQEISCDSFIFISAVTDRYAYFDTEVTPKKRTQNFAAAFNGGVFLNWFIPFCFQYFPE